MWRPVSSSLKMLPEPIISIMRTKGTLRPCALPQCLCHDRQEYLKCQVLPRGLKQFQTKDKKQCQCLQNHASSPAECLNIIDDDLGSNAACFAASLSQFKMFSLSPVCKTQTSMLVTSPVNIVSHDPYFWSQPLGLVIIHTVGPIT